MTDTYYRKQEHRAMYEVFNHGQMENRREDIAKQNILIVIDMQNDFISGTLGTEEAREIVGNVAQKVRDYKENGNIVLFTRDTHAPNYLDTYEGKLLPVPHCIRDTSGWQICGELKEYAKASDIIDKPTFGWANWNHTFCKRGITPERIEVVGLCTDICVVSNALILRSLYPETKIVVDASCCAGTTPEKHREALDTMRSCQITVTGNTEDAGNDIRAAEFIDLMLNSTRQDFERIFGEGVGCIRDVFDISCYGKDIVRKIEEYRRKEGN